LKVFLADGRALRYWSSAIAGPVVLFFHGCPDTRRIAMTGEVAAHEVGVRLLAFNRPGYGSSTPMDSTPASVARDARELLDLWGIDQVAVLGMSVGAMYAATFAATFPERTNALGLVSAPRSGEPTDESVEEAMERMRPEFEAWRGRIDPDDEDDPALAARFLAELPPSDADLLRPLGDEAVATMIWEAIVKPEGYLRDAALVLRPWDVDLSAVRCPVRIWCGDQDDKAVAAADWWTARLPGPVEVEIEPATGHLAALLKQWPEILKRLGTATG
jgi:pimeloyl-ACP methyl ester carboxylesterase